MVHNGSKESDEKVVIASPGRCGSTMLMRVLAKAYDSDGIYAPDVAKIEFLEELVVKTHDHYNGSLPEHYKVIYIYDNIFDIVHSFYTATLDENFSLRRKRERGEEGLPVEYPRIHFVTSHLRHLKVKSAHVKIFKLLLKFSVELSVVYLLVGDKFRFASNYRSWQGRSNVLFLKFSELSKDPHVHKKKIEDYLGRSVGDFPIRKRHSKNWKTGQLIRLAMWFNYPKGIFR